MDHCAGQFCSNKIMKIFKTDFFFFENSFNKDKSVGLKETPCTKKNPKICTGCRVRAAKIYLCHSTEIAKARPYSEGIS